MLLKKKLQIHYSKKHERHTRQSRPPNESRNSWKHHGLHAWPPTLYSEGGWSECREWDKPRLSGECWIYQTQKAEEGLTEYLLRHGYKQTCKAQGKTGLW